MDNTKLIQKMREAADWLEANPCHEIVTVSVLIHATREDKERLAQLVKAAGGVKKDVSDELIFVRAQRFLPVDFTIAGDREKVCERVVVGTKTLPAHDGYMVAAQPEREVEIVEWKCGSILETAEAE